MGWSPAPPAPARPSPCRLWRRDFRRRASRCLPPTSKAICPASPRSARPRRRSSSAPRIWGSNTSRTNFRRCSGISMASRATRSAPRSRKWDRCCCRGCSISTRPRKACSISPSASPTIRGSRFSISRTCAQCWLSSRNRPRKSRRPTATSPALRSAASSGSSWCSRTRAPTSSSASRRSTSRTSCAPTATGAA